MSIVAKKLKKKYEREKKYEQATKGRSAETVLLDRHEKGILESLTDENDVSITKSLLLNSPGLPL